jgi:transcriptional regulator with XRE-family HTH domain
MQLGMSNEKKLLRALGAQIKSARKSRGITQEKLAELCDFDPTYISLLETGGRNPPFLTICKLADKLGYPLERLVKGVE